MMMTVILFSLSQAFFIHATSARKKFIYATQSQSGKGDGLIAVAYSCEKSPVLDLVTIVIINIFLTSSATS